MLSLPIICKHARKSLSVRAATAGLFMAWVNSVGNAGGFVGAAAAPYFNQLFSLLSYGAVRVYENVTRLERGCGCWCDVSIAACLHNVCMYVCRSIDCPASTTVVWRVGSLHVLGRARHLHELRALLAICERALCPAIV